MKYTQLFLLFLTGFSPVSILAQTQRDAEQFVLNKLKKYGNSFMGDNKSSMCLSNVTSPPDLGN